MNMTREKSRTYEEIRDKYLYLVYRIQTSYALDEDDLGELVIRYCECIHNNLHRDTGWSGRLQVALVHKARQLIKIKERRAMYHIISLEELREILDENTEDDTYS